MTSELRTDRDALGGRTPRRNAEAGLSIVVPVFNEAGGLGALHARVAEAAQRLRAARGLECEVVYVDDGSRDDTLEGAQGLPAAGRGIPGLSLSGNFGKED